MPRKRYFGWAGHEPQDTRDIMYSVNPSILRDLPPSADLRGKFKTKPFNQGSLGSCGPQTAAADLLFDQEQTDAADTMPSRLYVYYNTRRLMGTVNQDSGVLNRTMCKALNQWGWCDESLWPYQISQFRTKPPERAYQDGGKRRVVRYERVATDLNQMKGALAQGDPFIFGFAVFQNIDDANQSGNIPMPGGSQVGGHDVLLVGYDDATQRFLLRNSWGTGWGDGGYGTIPYAYATNQQLCGDFWTLHWDDAGPKPPPDPPPTPRPPVDWPKVLCQIWGIARPTALEAIATMSPEWQASLLPLAEAADKSCAVQPPSEQNRTP